MIFCKNCKHFIEGYIHDYCELEYYYKITSYNKRKEYIVHNKNCKNDCKTFKPTVIFKIKKLLSLLEKEEI